MYQEFFLNADKIVLQGYHWQKSNPKAVICILHGIGEHAARYDKIGTFFNESDFAVLSMDLRGHGKSPGKRGHTAPRKNLFSDIDALIDYAGLQYPNMPIFLYGHSMGGNIGLDYRRDGAYAERLAGYIITAPWLTLYKKISEPMMMFALVLAKVKPDFQMDTGLSAKDLAHVESEVEAYTKDPLVHKKISVLTVVDALNAAAKILSGPSGNSKPLLLMHGTEDRICTIAGSRMVGNMEGSLCKFVEWEGSYHEIHNEKDGRKVLITIKDWILEGF